MLSAPGREVKNSLQLLKFPSLSAMLLFALWNRWRHEPGEVSARITRPFDGEHVRALNDFNVLTSQHSVLS
jgi:hypothetical protein